MKILKYALLAIPFLYFSCSDDDDAPEPINEEEVITTMTVTLVNHMNDSDVVTLQTQDLDGDGPNAPVVTVSGPLTSGTSYSGSIVWLNEMEDPAENVTEEIVEEQDLVHEPAKPNDGLDTAGGSIDIQTTFPVTVE